MSQSCFFVLQSTSAKDKVIENDVAQLIENERHIPVECGWKRVDAMVPILVLPTTPIIESAATLPRQYQCVSDCGQERTGNAVGGTNRRAIPIAATSRKQRAGRVGRISVGYVQQLCWGEYYRDACATF